MRVLNIRRHPPGGKALACFDVETDNGIRFYELKLTNGPNGLRVYGPRADYGAAVTFPRPVVDNLVALAREALANDPIH